MEWTCEGVGSEALWYWCWLLGVLGTLVLGTCCKKNPPPPIYVGLRPGRDGGTTTGGPQDAVPGHSKGKETKNLASPMDPNYMTMVGVHSEQVLPDEDGVKRRKEVCALNDANYMTMAGIETSEILSRDK